MQKCWPTANRWEMRCRERALEKNKNQIYMDKLNKNIKITNTHHSMVNTGNDCNSLLTSQTSKSVKQDKEIHS